MGSPWKVFAAFAVIFMAGTLFGGFFAMGIGQRIMRERQQPPPSPQLMRLYIMRLELSEAQKTRIKPIVDKAEMEVNVIQQRARVATAAEIKPTLDKLESDFEKELNPEQQKILVDLKKRRLPLFEGMDQGGRSGGRGGGPPGIPRGQGGQTPGGGQGGNFSRGGQQQGRPGQGGGNPQFRGGSPNVPQPAGPATPAAPSDTVPPPASEKAPEPATK